MECLSIDQHCTFRESWSRDGCARDQHKSSYNVFTLQVATTDLRDGSALVRQIEDVKSLDMPREGAISATYSTSWALRCIVSRHWMREACSTVDAPRVPQA